MTTLALKISEFTGRSFVLPKLNIKHVKELFLRKKKGSIWVSLKEMKAGNCESFDSFETWKKDMEAEEALVHGN